MNVIIAKDYDEMSKKAAAVLLDVVKNTENPVLGLATGSSPIGTYQEMVKDHQENGTDYSKVVSYNLDEYVGLPITHKESYYAFMHQHLFNHVNIKEENVHVPNGNPENAEEYCASYDESIKAAGGIDIQVLGIGRNGHIGFNEPADEFTAGTYKVQLTESTIEANKIYFESENDVPREAITMGVQSIINAKEIILIAEGNAKAQAIHDMIKGEISPACPASILQKHNNVHIFIDNAAAALL